MLDALILINGVPASGKSTLGRLLAEQLALPLLSKDGIKEALWDASPPTAGVEPLVWSRRLGAIAYELLWQLSPNLGPRLILEAPLTFAQEEAVRGLHEAPIELYLRAAPEEIWRRHHDRQELRHDCHRHHPLPNLDDVVASMAVARPLDLGGPLLMVDTTEGVDGPQVARWVREHLV